MWGAMEDARFSCGMGSAGLLMSMVCRPTWCAKSWKSVIIWCASCGHVDHVVNDVPWRDDSDEHSQLFVAKNTEPGDVEGCNDQEPLHTRQQHGGYIQVQASCKTRTFTGGWQDGLRLIKGGLEEDAHVGEVVQAGQAPGAGEVGGPRRLVKVQNRAGVRCGIRRRQLAGQAPVVLQPVRLRLLLLLVLLLLLLHA